MKIAMVLPGGVDRSGEVRVIPAFLALIRRLSRHHEVHVVALRQEPERGSWPLCGAMIHNPGRRATAWRAFQMLRAEHRRGRFDVVQSLFGGECALLGLLCARGFGVPFAVHVAGGELVALRDIGYGGGIRPHGRLREKLVLRAADAVTAASAGMLETLASIGVCGRRLPLGVDLEEWPPRAPRARDPAAPLRLIHVASLNRVKDQGTLLRSLALLAARSVDFTLDVVGDDTLGGAVQADSARLGLGSRVRFRGFLRQRELRPLMESVDLSVMTSRHEAGPLVLMEAAAAGVPTVGTEVGHIAEWAPHAAVAVPVADPAALADAIAALANDEPRRFALAQAAGRRAREEDADFTARGFLDLHTDLARAPEDVARRTR
jgi:glycosyltransferase involved in cell wall biosynthesis